MFVFCRHDTWSSSSSCIIASLYRTKIPGFLIFWITPGIPSQCNSPSCILLYHTDFLLSISLRVDSLAKSLFSCCFLPVRFAPYRPPDILPWSPCSLKCPASLQSRCSSLRLGFPWNRCSFWFKHQREPGSRDGGKHWVKTKTAIISRLLALSCHGTRMEQIASDIAPPQA